MAFQGCAQFSMLSVWCAALGHFKIVPCCFASSFLPFPGADALPADAWKRRQKKSKMGLNVNK